MSVELLNIDCMEYMATLPDKAFDLAIVDPPYGLDMARKGAVGVGDKMAPSTVFSAKEWDSNPPDKAYFDELRRVSKNQIIWGGPTILSAGSQLILRVGSYGISIRAGILRIANWHGQASIQQFGNSIFCGLGTGRGI